MRILIADDHVLFRQDLKAILETRPGFDIVGEAEDGKQAVALALQLRPDVVLMDLAMPVLDGLAATRHLLTHAPEVRVIILTASEDDQHLFEAIRSGAQGYLMKNLEISPFFALLEGVVRGEPAITPALARRLMQEFKHRDPVAEPFAVTEREKEVLQHLVAGTTSNRAIAKELGVSENTIKFHMRNILDKFHAANRAQVVAFALKNKLV